MRVQQLLLGGSPCIPVQQCARFMRTHTSSPQVQELLPGGAPAWLTGGDGRVVMSLLCVLVVFPLSCLRRMREVSTCWVHSLQLFGSQPCCAWCRVVQTGSGDLFERVAMVTPAAPARAACMLRCC